MVKILEHGQVNANKRNNIFKASSTFKASYLKCLFTHVSNQIKWNLDIRNSPQYNESKQQFLQQFDHGPTVFDCRACLTMVGDCMTVVCDHGE